MRAQLRRAAEKYGGPLTSNSLTRSLDKEIDLLKSSESLCAENRGNIDLEVKEEVERVIEGNVSKGYGSDQMVHKLESMRSSSASAEICPSNNVHADCRDNSTGMSPQESKKIESPIIPVDFLCPISLELMRDPVIVATGQV